MSIKNAIYKRYRGSELDEPLVIADALAVGSVDRTLKGKHYWRGLRCLRAWFECLLFQLLKDESVHLPYDVQEKLDILRSSGSSVEKECNYEELMDPSEVNDLITAFFRVSPCLIWLNILERLLIYVGCLVSIYSC